LVQDRLQVRFLNEYGHWSENWINVDSDMIRPCSLAIETQPAHQQRENHDPNESISIVASPYRILPAGVSTDRGRKRTALSTRHTRAIDAASERYSMYLDALLKHGLQVQPITGDGNCLFRSVSHQIYSDDKWHKLVRAKCMDYMESERDFFEPYIEGGSEGFTAYLNWKRQDAVWGDDPEVQAFCEIYDCAAEIWAFDAREGAKMLRTFHETDPQSISKKTIRLSYYGGGHYDSLVAIEGPSSGKMGLYPKLVPGVMEDRAILLSSARKIARGEDVTSSNESKSLESAGLIGIETENDMLRLGRSHFDAYHGLLDDALAVSLILEDETEASKMSELLSLQDQMIANAQQLSDEEQIQAALRLSVTPEKGVISSHFTPELHMTEDDALREAMRLSVSDFASPTSSKRKIECSEIIPGKMGFYHEDEQFDAEIEEARIASLRDQSGVLHTLNANSDRTIRI
jgi:hypothetical protein